MLMFNTDICLAYDVSRPVKSIKDRNVTL